jgi:hypothetical protein
MKKVFVVQEDDSTIIGVATTAEKAKEMILEYYGESSEITHFNDIRDSGIECIYDVCVKRDCYGVTVYYFNIDEL